MDQNAFATFCQATCTGKINYWHGHVVVVFKNLHEKFRKLGVDFAPSKHKFIFKSLTHQTGFSFSILPLQWNLFIFLYYMPKIYVKIFRRIPEWIDTEENIQKMKFNY